MIDLELVPEHSEYVLREEVRFKLRITNRGGDPLELLDPAHPASSLVRYTVEGPEIDRTISFTAAELAVADGELDPEEPPEEVETIVVEAGETWEGLAEFWGNPPFSHAGDYGVQATLSAPGVLAESKEVWFKLRRFSLSTIHLGLGAMSMGKGEGELALFHQGTKASSLYTLTYLETRDDLGEVDADSPINRGEFGAEATDVGVPWTNAPIFEDLVRWTIWREGKKIFALSNVSQTPASVEAPGEISYLVRPPLKPASGPLEILAVSEDGSKLHAIRFEIGKPADQPKGGVAWSFSLPTDPLGITARLAPGKAGDVRHVALIAENDGKRFAGHTTYTAGKDPGPLSSVGLPKLRPVAGTPMALHVDEKGHVRMDALFIESGEVERCVVTQVRNLETPDKADIESVPVTGLPGLPVAGAVLFVTRRDGSVKRRDIVIAMEDGELFKVGSSGSATALELPAPPTWPMLLAPGNEVSYIVCFTPERGPFLEPF